MRNEDAYVGVTMMCLLFCTYFPRYFCVQIIPEPLPCSPCIVKTTSISIYNIYLRAMFLCIARRRIFR